ncbi:MAG: MurT ligase domain-containing protein [Clostridia bacterium]|nr:MurT ligase domain-containing protein [Clostridia bacterium]
MKALSILLGKSVKKIAQLKGSNGSALPGLLVEKTDRDFVRKVLKNLPYGVVVVSGTNGKTTTTKIITELLEKQGLKVFTNKTGSNFVRGVISAILDSISFTGKFDYDIAVLELDEAYSVKFCEVADVDYALLLNVQRDQLDRFGEIDYTAELLQKLASHVKKTVVLNREDPRVSKIEAKNKSFFGLSEKMMSFFPSDDCLLSKEDFRVSTTKAKVIFESLEGREAEYSMDGQKCSCHLTLKGNYNAYNAAGALALCLEILPDVPFEKLVGDLANIKSAFGRGEDFVINGKNVELLLVKNPSAFQLSLTSFADDDYDYMICINDNDADGRDVSWLWNVDFDCLREVKYVSGIRAADMALRLKYDGVKVGVIEENLEKALNGFTSEGDKPKRIFSTYTSMLELRKIILGKSLI